MVSSVVAWSRLDRIIRVLVGSCGPPPCWPPAHHLHYLHFAHLANRSGKWFSLHPHPKVGDTRRVVHLAWGRHMNMSLMFGHQSLIADAALYKGEVPKCCIFRVGKVIMDCLVFTRQRQDVALSFPEAGSMCCFDRKSS